MNIINPLNIKQNDLPLFVLSDDMRNFLGWAIKSHSKGNWNHIMIMVNPEKVVTQGWTYKEIPITHYMRDSIRLKFWQCKNIPIEKKIDIRDKVNKDLKENWWKKRYDFLGIIGQAFNIRWLNNPLTKYCSERVAIYLRMLGLPIPQHPSPAEINALFIKNSRMYLYGYWDKEMINGENI